MCQALWTQQSKSLPLGIFSLMGDGQHASQPIRTVRDGWAGGRPVSRGQRKEGPASRGTSKCKGPEVQVLRGRCAGAVWTPQRGACQVTGIDGREQRDQGCPQGRASRALDARPGEGV